MSMKMRPVKSSQKRTRNPNSSTKRTSREKPTERVRPRQPERKELWHIPEPLLEFAHGQMVEYPRDGLYLFGPCDSQKRPGVTRYGVIGTREGVERSGAFQRRCVGIFRSPSRDLAAARSNLSTCHSPAFRRPSTVNGRRSRRPS